MFNKKRTKYLNQDDKKQLLDLIEKQNEVIQSLVNKIDLQNKVLNQFQEKAQLFFAFLP